jgi:hypothetical protein
MVIDPTSSGARSPADLYHAVVQSTGAAFYRGVATAPPTCVRKPWAADVEYASAVTAERWIVEMRIPLASFDEPAGAGRVWAINFARFDAARQEYSNWSGAVGAIFDPLSMGNLTLP